MLRLLVLIISALLVLSGTLSSATTIVSDDFGGEINLSMLPGLATGGFTIDNADFSMAVYNISVYISNEVVSYQGQSKPQEQSFYVINSFASATLLNSFYYPGTLSASTNQVVLSGTVSTANYLGSDTAPNTAVGTYVYQFSIPLGKTLNVNIIYSNQGNPTVTDNVRIAVVNTHA